ncbi:uncharacterized protein PV09_05014 [Verruconis gallopava]|uniref:Kinetochore protein mis13 n=1 Tax=Verruconis gallopava TaxID=253628 RepID=A0A0D2AWZ5_9PEZI|nr:uncharacterized protein PV09_05014 [Verruconis gallopava]KIW03699.1 hypothetical protein PV09_05014 [Verruconis gallopava]
MTAIHSRAPLEVLSMSAAQRQSRRKTTRHLFDDDDEPPAKRSKVETETVSNAASAQSTSRIAAAKPKKARTAYNEDADGFTFARKTRSKKSSDEPVPVNEAQASHSTASKPRLVPRTKRNDSKTDPRIASTSSETDLTGPRRRSARLSGDKEAVQSLPAEKPKRKRKSNELGSSQRARAGSPELPPKDLQIERKREGTKIMLPFADTPVINRNKEMRATKSKTQNRRSSVNSRGRRASSLIESGTSNGRTFRTYGSNRTPRSAQKFPSFSSFLSDYPLDSQRVSIPVLRVEESLVQSACLLRSSNNFNSISLSYDLVLANQNELTAVPHSDVDIKDFYKHIEQSLLEPKRMRQLLTWSATRALPPKAHGGSGNASETFIQEAARSIIEDLLKDFANKPEMSDWFSRDETSEPTAIVKKPNPRNAQNAARLQRLEADIARLKEEERQWNELTKSLKSEEVGDLDDIDPSALDPAQAALLAELQLGHDASGNAKKRRKSEDKEEAHTTGLEDIAARMQAINSNLEPQIDMFADGLHRVGQYRLAAERVADRLLGTTARKLEIREKESQKATGTSSMGSKEVLSALARALYARGDGR